MSPLALLGFDTKSKLRCFFLFSFILLHCAIECLLDFLAPGREVDVAQLGKSTSARPRGPQIPIAV
jgi:hypothetical protein